MILVKVQTQKSGTGPTPFKFRRILKEHLLDSINSHQPAFVHEFLLERGKPFLDVDYNDGLETDVENFIHSLLATLARYLGWSADVDDYAFMRCFYDRKISLHVVNCVQEYESFEHQLAHMQQKQFPFDNFGIDKNLFKRISSLRTIGGSKWDDQPPNPFRLITASGHVVESSLTMLELDRCLVQVRNPDATLIRFIPDEPVPLGARPRRRDPIADAIRTVQQGDPQIRTCVAFLKSLCRPEPELADRWVVSAISKSKKTIKYCISNHGLCDCFESNLEVAQNTELLTVSFSCSKGCEKGQPRLSGYTPVSSKYVNQRNYLAFLVQHKCCRADLPLLSVSNSKSSIWSFGRYCCTMKDFFDDLWTSLRDKNFTCFCSWCQAEEPSIPDCFCSFYEDPMIDAPFDANFWNFLRNYDSGLNQVTDLGDSSDPFGTENLLIGYMCLFIGYLSKVQTWIVRGKSSFICQKKQELEGMFTHLVYFVEIKKRKDEYEIVPKPFWPLFVKKNQHVYNEINQNEMLFSPGAPFNDMTPVEYDLNVCVRSWYQLEAKNKVFLEWILDTYLEMLVMNELPQDKDYFKKYILWWLCSILFHPRTPTHVILFLLSFGGGQGKSTLGQFFSVALGKGNSAILSVAQMLGQFNHFFGLNIVDEVTMTHAQAEQFKAISTSAFEKIEKKFANPYQGRATRNWFMTSNNLQPKFFNKRRFCAFKLSEIGDLEHNEIFNFTCDSCTEEESVWGVCAHTCNGHADFIRIFYSAILNFRGKDDCGKGFFFDQFVGLLSVRYKALKASGFCAGSLQGSLRNSRCMLDLQNVIDTPVSKFVDHILQQGYHWHPSVQPEHLNSCWTIMESHEFLLINAPEPTWLTEIPLSTLFAFFQQWQTERKDRTVISYDGFFTELELLCLKKTKRELKKGIFQAKARKYKFAVMFQGVPASYNPLSNNYTDTPCLNLGTRESWMEVAAPEAPPSSLDRVASDLMTLVANSQNVPEPEEFGRAAIRISANNDSTNWRAGFAEPRFLLMAQQLRDEEEAANFAFEDQRIVEGEDEYVDEDEQDREAEREDKRAHKLRQRAAQYLDTMAEVAKDKEEEEDGDQEPPQHQVEELSLSSTD